MASSTSNTTVNNSAWLTHELVGTALRDSVNYPSATLDAFGAEAHRVGATALAAELRDYATQRELDEQAAALAATPNVEAAVSALRDVNRRVRAAQYATPHGAPLRHDLDNAVGSLRDLARALRVEL